MPLVEPCACMIGHAVDNGCSLHGIRASRLRTISDSSATSLASPSCRRESTGLGGAWLPSGEPLACCDPCDPCDRCFLSFLPPYHPYPTHVRIVMEASSPPAWVGTWVAWIAWVADLACNHFPDALVVSILGLAAFLETHPVNWSPLHGPKLISYPVYGRHLAVLRHTHER